MTADRSPVLIVGAGLAGLHLAWALYLRNQSFRIISMDTGFPAWKASAGIINPVTGKRVVKSWRIDELLPFSKERYKQVSEKLIKPSCYRSKRLIRYFRGDPDERKRFEERSHETEFQKYLNPLTIEDDSGFEIAHSGWVDVSQFVKTSRTFLKSRNLLRPLTEPFAPKAIQFRGKYLEWNNQPWQQIVFCEGYHGVKNPYFDWLDYRISRGDVIDFSTTNALPKHILNREKWVLPLGAHTGRAGSSYVWQDLEKSPEAEDASPLLSAWSDKLVNIENSRITKHRVGIRPGTNDSKPYVGPHPEDERLCILNGFGSKGSSQSPWCAELLADFLINASPLPTEITPARRLKFLKHPPAAPKEIRSR